MLPSYCALQLPFVNMALAGGDAPKATAVVQSWHGLCSELLAGSGLSSSRPVSEGGPVGLLLVAKEHSIVKLQSPECTEANGTHLHNVRLSILWFADDASLRVTKHACLAAETASGYCSRVVTRWLDLVEDDVCRA